MNSSTWTRGPGGLVIASGRVFFLRKMKLYALRDAAHHPSAAPLSSAGAILLSTE